MTFIKTIFNTVLLSTFILTTPVFSAEHTSAADSTLPKAPYVTAQTIKQWQDEKKDFQFVDVRLATEFAPGHLPNAINIPYTELEQRVNEVPTDKPVVFYCTLSSWRAPYAGNLLADLGYKNVYVLDGGASGWNAGGQVIYANDSTQTPQIVAKPKGLEAEFHYPPMRQYTTKIDLNVAQLKEFDGKNGRPAYVAAHGVIYDVTESRLWRGGEHDPSHGEAFAGNDLTEQLKLSPHGDKHFSKFPIVGKLVK